MVLLRYGSLKDFTQVVHTHKEIGEQLGIKQNSVETILRMHRRNGFTIVNKYRSNGPKIRPEFSQVAPLLKDSVMLQQWAGLSISQRSRLLRF